MALDLFSLGIISTKCSSEIVPSRRLDDGQTLQASPTSLQPSMKKLASPFRNRSATSAEFLKSIRRSVCHAENCYTNEIWQGPVAGTSPVTLHILSVLPVSRNMALVLTLSLS